MMLTISSIHATSTTTDTVISLVVHVSLKLCQRWLESFYCTPRLGIVILTSCSACADRNNGILYGSYDINVDGRYYELYFFNSHRFFFLITLFQYRLNCVIRTNKCRSFIIYEQRRNNSVRRLTSLHRALFYLFTG